MNTLSKILLRSRYRNIKILFANCFINAKEFLNEQLKNYYMQLQSGTLLQGGKYKIERVLGQGGFGITYLAENTMLEGKVAIKEFFFKEYCNRDGETSHVTIPTEGNRELVNRFKQKFIKEARTIFKLNHPNIVRILDIFEENGTAYYVMDYIDGESLGDMVKRCGAIPESEAIGYIKEVASALSYIHGEKINHLDIKPGNVMKRGKDGQILVIDFGVAKQYDTETAEGTTTTPVGISHGYSPMEQYQRHGVQTFSPQSDVYALAATLYKLLTGITPPEAIEIQDQGLPLEPLETKHISETVIAAIINAMKSRSQRTQSVDTLIVDLKGLIETTVVVEHESKLNDHKDKFETNTGISRLFKKFIVWIAFAGVVAVGVLFLMHCKSDNNFFESNVADYVEDREIECNRGPENRRQFKYTGLLKSLCLQDSLGVYPIGRGKAIYQKTSSSPIAIYEGYFAPDFVCHDTTGTASLLLENGDLFIGKFEDGYYTEGKYTVKEDGYYFLGTFRSGNPCNGEWYDKNGIFDCAVINGSVK